MADPRVLPLQPRRYLGLDLSGAKSEKTALAVLEYYPKEQKVFLLDIFDRIGSGGAGAGADGAVSSDEALLETIHEAIQSESHRAQKLKLAVNVPTTLPPCIPCTKKTCVMPSKCAVPAIKYMREQTAKARVAYDLDVNVLEFTPYTQRPFEIFARYQILPRLPKEFRFEIDEALGGNRAPLTARMHFLQWHLQDLDVVEVWPKLTVAILAYGMGIPKRVVAAYRKPEEGYSARMEILETIALKKGVFIYDRDLKKLAQSLTAFDSFLCAYTALLVDREFTAKPPKGFPVASGWVHYPMLPKEGSAREARR